MTSILRVIFSKTEKHEVKNISIQNYLLINLLKKPKDTYKKKIFIHNNKKIEKIKIKQKKQHEKDHKNNTRNPLYNRSKQLIYKMKKFEQISRRFHRNFLIRDQVDHSLC